MSTVILPSNRALCSNDTSFTATAAAQIRTQEAVVRALLDEVDRVVPGSTAHVAMSEQLAEELARLGRDLLSAATRLSERSSAEPASGVRPTRELTARQAAP